MHCILVHNRFYFVRSFIESGEPFRVLPPTLFAPMVSLHHKDWRSVSICSARLWRFTCTARTKHNKPANYSSFVTIYQNYCVLRSGICAGIVRLPFARPLARLFVSAHSTRPVVRLACYRSPVRLSSLPLHPLSCKVVPICQCAPRLTMCTAFRRLDYLRTCTGVPIVSPAYGICSAGVYGRAAALKPPPPLSMCGKLLHELRRLALQFCSSFTEICNGFFMCRVAFVRCSRLYLLLKPFEGVPCRPPIFWVFHALR